ncbi:hypothetical protein BG005_002592, partial [Podila minutissima]
MATSSYWHAATTQVSKTLIPNAPLHVTWEARPNSTLICDLAIVSYEFPKLTVEAKRTSCTSGSDTLLVPVTPLNTTL